MDAIQRWQEAERLGAAQGVQQARAAYVGLLEERGVAPYAHLRLSVADQQIGDVRGAVAHALSAFEKAHADPELLEMLCKLLLRLGETRAALACANALLGLDPSAGALAEVGKMFSDRMLPDVALPLVQRAMLKGMANAPAMQYLLGLNLMYAGNLVEAREALENSVRGNPALVPAHWALAKLGDAASRGIRIDRLQRVLGSRDKLEGDSSLLWYSLFHELDRDDQRAAAWDALEQGMRLRRRQVPYDEKAQDSLFAAATDALEQLRGSEDAAAEISGPMPVFIVGLPRTGTTVIEQRLCAQAAVASAGELRDLEMQMRWVAEQAGPSHFDALLLRSVTAEQANLLGTRYLGHSQWRACGQAFYTDKWPENYLAIAHILRAIPNARVVCVRRGAVDACFSNLKEWFAASYFYSYDMAEVAHQYARFDRFMNAVESTNSPRVAFVEYEMFVRKPEAVTSELMQTLGLPARDAAREPGSVATASSIQVRGDISTRHVGSWSRYAPRLAPLLSELARLGYRQDQTED